MILVDTALQRRERDGHPVRVAMIGAGFMGRGIVRQIATAIPGMRVIAIACRSLEPAARAFTDAGVDDVETVSSESELAAAVAAGRVVVTTDWRLLCTADEVDAVIEVTGSIEYAAHVACAAIANRKHVVLMNAELDGTVGPLLKQWADDAGVVFTNVDGDQPGVTLNLYRFVKGIGVRPVVCGNIKGLHDPYRNPETQAEFARRWGQKPHMVTSFADGTKISFEQAIIANATGMTIARRGMLGPTVETGTPIAQAAAELDAERFLDGPGIVDYVVGAEPSPGVFVLGTIEDPVQRHYLDLYKLGKGPLYCFYTPYHLCHFEVPNTVARAVLFGDATIAPAGPPMVEVVAAAKTDIPAGTVLDDLGHFMTYGLCESADITRNLGLLPIGVAPGCKVLRDVARDEVLAYQDVALPEGRLIDQLRRQQDELFADRLAQRSSVDRLSAHQRIA